MSNGEDPTVFTVIGAKGLKADAEVGTFVTVSIGNQTLFRTKSVTGESPHWNDSHPIPVTGPQSFSIAIHRESPKQDTFLGEIKDIIVGSGPTGLIVPIGPLMGGRQIVVTVSIKSLQDMSIPGDSNHYEHLVCLSNFIIKSLSDRHPDLPRSACLSVAIIVNGNSLYETVAVKKGHSESHWNCNGKAILSSGVAYTFQVINEAASKKRLGFLLLDRDVLEKPQEKRVRRKLVQYTNGDPWLEIIFTAQVLGLGTSDTLPQAGESIARTNSGISRARLPLSNALASYGATATLLNSNQPSSSQLSSTLGGSNRGDILSCQIIGPLSNEPPEASRLVALGVQLLEQFESEQNLASLDRAILVFHDTMKLLPDGHQDRAFYLWKYGVALHHRFWLLNKLPDINLGIELLEKSISLFADGHASKTTCIRELGVALHCRYERLGDISDLQKIISVKEKALELTPTGHSDKAECLSDLGNSFWNRFERLGEIADLDKAISLKENAVKHTPTGHPDEAKYLDNIGTLSQTRYQRLGEIPDLEKGVSVLENAVRLTPIGDSRKALYLSNFGSLLQDRFGRLGKISDLEKGILIFQNAIQLTPPGHPSKGMNLNNLGTSFQNRFDRLGEISDLEKAISVLENAVAVTPASHPGKATCFINLGNTFLIRFERLGEIPDLEKAISALQKAVELTPTGHQKAQYLNSLGRSFHKRFERLGEISDLEKAISILEDVDQLTPTGHPKKALYLCNLGNSIWNRFERLGEISDMERGISIFKNTVDLTPTNHPSKGFYLNNLGNSLQSRFKILEDISDAKQAISVLENAVELIPTGHPGQAKCFNNLGNSFQMQFEMQGEIPDLDKAISAKENAVELTPTGYSDKAIYLSNLGQSYQTRFEQQGKTSDQNQAIHCFSQASQSPTSAPGIQLQAAIFWATCAMKARLSPMEAYNKAIQLLPHVAWIGLPIIDRYQLISDMSSVVHYATAAAVLSGQYEKALEWLEQGRSIVWGQLLQLRTPVDDLYVKEPNLASQLLSVSQALEKTSAREIDVETDLSAEKIAQKHHLLASQWEKLIQKVQLVPGFEGFLQPKTISQLIPAAKLGPIIVISIHTSGCHALILNTTVVHIPLPNFSYENAQDMLLALRRLSRSKFARELVFEDEKQTPLSTFEEVLSDLWTCMVLPILNGLALSVSGSSKLPHIWWCPTGPLAFLPIHAAGLYNTEEPGHKLSDFAISSYTPTITALLKAQHNSPSTTFKILAVAQESNHGQLRLHNTNPEVENLKKHAGQLHVESLKGTQATVDHVVQGMSESTWVHLACHGTQNPSDPMKSAFILADGHLELSRITKISLPQAEFAFLSACHTAAGDMGLQEEAVHLAAGMLMAGYRSVIATMWSIRDQDAPQVADDVYAELFRNGQPDHTRSAHALHHAMQALRRTGAPFRSWVPFIHLGR